ncbi:hypothetical protein [Litoreibacter roseus]|uniref:Uncharacterized protein n=1 Tax=Litoreibacter roseus TaxID=2601869 RepID=A0A6N6JB70_9RHOB|nr:hypothetical protein [Litoreibacter roseus]GFE63483.1 hypothetical protein KIN_05570 [Litoreibacter roseus]
MRRIIPLFLLSLAACDATLMPGDRSGPTISVIGNINGGGPVLASSDESVEVNPAACPPGRTAGQSGEGFVYNTPGLNPQPLSFLFSDKSGIVSYSVTVGTPALIDLPTETEVRPDGSLGTREIYEVTKTGNFKTAETVNAEIRVISTGAGNPFHGHQVILRATDQAGNTSTFPFFMMNTDLRCGPE